MTVSAATDRKRSVQSEQWGEWCRSQEFL